MTDQKTILVIDDDDTMRTLVKASLEQHGFKALTASGGKEGLALAATEFPDLIILDWMMPQIDGHDVLKILQEEHALQNIPVIMLTSKNEINNFSETLALGVADYIVKPFDLDDLVLRIKSILPL